MNSPCKKCVVNAMCQESCELLRNYIDKTLSKACHIGRCDTDFLDITSKRVRKQKYFVHKIMATGEYYTMIVTNTNIVVEPRFKDRSKL